MLSFWRPLCLHASATTYIRVARARYYKGEPASLWAFRKTSKWDFTISQRHSSRLVERVRQEGFRTHSGISIKPGDTVELEGGSFLRVKIVLQDGYHNSYRVVGWRFIQNNKTCGLPRQDPIDPKEVCWVVHLIKNDPRPAEDQALVEVEGSQILRKKTMTMVNTTYPGHHKGTGADFGVPGHDALFCRWKHVTVTKTSKKTRPVDAFHIPAAEISEASLQRLSAEGCDDGHDNRIADATLRRIWRGVTRRGGASVEGRKPNSLQSAVKALSLDGRSRNESPPAAYTFADVCCGAGGASHGARMAGLQLRWALDNNDPACDTFHLNFPEARLYCKEIEDVAQMHRKGLKTDIMHLSPPCQPFSKANTTPNLEKDTANIATNMSIGYCLDKARPRIATLEQTSGLMSDGYVGGRHNEHWSKLIEQFTSRGYSVAWKIMDLAELGLAQHRKRLIMIASCPGEALPSFPEPTHAKDPVKTGLTRFTSIKDAIGNIPPEWPDHDIPKDLPRPRKTSNENEPLPYIVTTHRSENTHPNGRRTPSLRELACLQGFSLKHLFPTQAKKKEIMNQIGNAFPPPPAAVLFESIKHQLLIRDKLMPQRLPKEGRQNV